MADEQPLSEKQSLELITGIINKTRCDYQETGIGALMWGLIVMLCSLVSFGNFYWKINGLDYIWLLTLIGVIPQIIISVRTSKNKKFKTHSDDAMAAIWISFGIALCLVSVLTNRYAVPKTSALFLIIYGMPTFATGYIRHFTPMVTGGIVFWVLAVVSFFIDYPFVMLCTAAGACIGWFLPGIILRRRYMNAKKNNV